MEKFMIKIANYKEIVEFIGHPPCEKSSCLVRMTCFDVSIWEDDDDIVIELGGPCEEARDWFITAEIIDDELELLRKEDGSIISAEDIKKIIKYWDCDAIFLEEGIGLPFSTINKIGTYINELNSDFCSTEKIDSKEVIIMTEPIEEAFEYLERNPDYMNIGVSIFDEEKKFRLH